MTFALSCPLSPISRKEINGGSSSSMTKDLQFQNEVSLFLFSLIEHSPILEKVLMLLVRIRLGSPQTILKQDQQKLILKLRLQFTALNKVTPLVSSAIATYFVIICNVYIYIWYSCYSHFIFSFLFISSYCRQVLYSVI